MAAPLGNRFWEARSSHGRNPIFASPDDLWDACVEYFAWVEDHPLYETRAYSSKDGVRMAEVPKMRAMTIAGLCLFLDIHQSTWAEYRKRDGFGPTCARVDDVIRTQKFAGAAADLLNPSIIARDLGLADRAEHLGRDGGPIERVTRIELVAGPLEPE